MPTPPPQKETIFCSACSYLQKSHFKIQEQLEQVQHEQQGAIIWFRCVYCLVLNM